MTSMMWGGLLGAVAASGLLVVGSRLLATRRPTLESRIAPYIRDVPTRARLWTPRPPTDSALAALAAITGPFLETGGERLQRILGGRASVQRRLERAGSGLSVEQFRISQVEWALAGFGGMLVVGVLGPARQPGRAVPWLLLCFGMAGLAMIMRDSLLSRQVRNRERRMLAEFPAVADMLALSVAAGEGPVAALDRVVSSCRGALVEELARVLAESRTGVPMVTALDGLAARTGLAVVARFADGLAVALARGTPLVDVLAAQAADVREAAKRALIETGARKEVVMMVPVVFLILPVTLLFAFYPGVVGLNLLAP
jgi:tight adherence protein C